MAFNLRPYKELVALTKEKLDEAMAPIRARSAQAKAELELAKIDEKLISLEQELNTECAAKDLNFDRILDKLDEFELQERRKKQITNLISQLFPKE